MNRKTISRRWSTYSVVASLAFAAVACGTSTRFLSTWSPRNAQPIAANGMKIATVFFNGNESIRRTGEDAIVNELARIGGTAIPSYSVIPDDPKDKEAAKKKLEKAGVDVVMSMRVVAAERVYTYTPGYWNTGPYYGSLWGYWGYGWGAAYDAGYLSSSVVVGVETLLYSLKTDKLLWAGMSETFDPNTVRSAVKSIAKKAVSKMEEQGVLAPGVPVM